MEYLVVMLGPMLGLGVLLKQEKEKKREYNKRIMNTEHSTFTPLVFLVSGLVGNKYSMSHKHMAEKIALINFNEINFNDSYEKVVTVIRCKLFIKLSLSILRSALLCLIESRYNYVLKYIDEFYLAFDSAGL